MNWLTLLVVRSLLTASNIRFHGLSKCAFLAITICFFVTLTIIPASAQHKELIPAWSLEIKHGHPKLIKNKFGPSYRHGGFPLRTLRIQKTFERKEAYPPIPGRLVALLEVSKTGKPISMSEFVDGGLVSSGAYEIRGSILTDSLNHKSGSRSQAGFSYVSNANIDVKTVGGWDKAPNETFSIIPARAETYVVDPRDSSILLSYPGTTSFLTISRGSEKAAFVIVGIGAPARETGPPYSVPTKSKIVVIKYDGKVLSDPCPSHSHFWYPYMTPNGEFLVVGEITDPNAKPYYSTFRLVVMDLNSQNETVVIDLPFGVPYFSGDGRFMAYVSREFTKIDYYDMTDPTRPELLWEYVENVLIGSVAVSEYGEYIAIDQRARGELVKKLHVFDADKNLVGICTNSEINETIGVMFVGNHLIKGTKNHPVPACADFEDTKRLDLFILR